MIAVTGASGVVGGRAAALLAERGGTYDVTGRDASTLAEVAAELSRLTGRPIAFRDETLEEARASRAGYGAPDWLVDAWISTYTAIAAGELATVSDTVARLAGHEPLTLADLVGENVNCGWVGERVSAGRAAILKRCPDYGSSCDPKAGRRLEKAADTAPSMPQLTFPRAARERPPRRPRHPSGT